VQLMLSSGTGRPTTRGPCGPGAAPAWADQARAAWLAAQGGPALLWAMFPPAAARLGKPPGCRCSGWALRLGRLYAPRAVRFLAWRSVAGICTAGVMVLSAARFRWHMCWPAAGRRGWVLTRREATAESARSLRANWNLPAQRQRLRAAGLRWLRLIGSISDTVWTLCPIGWSSAPISGLQPHRYGRVHAAERAAAGVNASLRAADRKRATAVCEAPSPNPDGSPCWWRGTGFAEAAVMEREAASLAAATGC